MSDYSRRLLGAVLGLVLGLTYGLVSQIVNRVALPGVPVYQPEPGPVAVILLTALGGGVIGLLTAWWDESIQGVVLAGLVGALLSSLFSVYTVRTSMFSAERMFSAYVLLFITFLPRAFLFLPIAALIRWVLNTWQNEVLYVTFSLRKMALSVAAILILALVGGALSLYPQEARYALQKTNDLIQSGMGAQSRDELPDALKSVEGFVQGANGEYSLLLGNDPDVLPVQRPLSSYTVNEYAVFVNFENGYRFGCAFTPPHPEPSCGIY